MAASATPLRIRFAHVAAVADVNGIVPEKRPTIGMINEHPQSDHMLESERLFVHVSSIRALIQPSHSVRVPNSRPTAP